MFAAVVAMTTMIVVVDQLFWRPLVAWSERYKFEDVGSSTSARSWLLDLLRRSQLYVWVGKLRARLRDRFDARPEKASVSDAPRSTRNHTAMTVLTVTMALALGVACVWGSVKLAAFLQKLEAPAWTSIARATGLTLVRTTAAVALGTLWTVPAGVYIGTHPRASRFLQPIVQVAASFPAPMLFPVVLLLLAQLNVPLGVGSVALMMLGTQWYILFNVIAGAMSIPHDLVEAADVYRLGRWQRWRLLLLPGVFPSLVTGWVTAAGGAWNASIVAEYVHAAGKVQTADGLGAIISIAADKGDLPLLAAGVLTMATVVVLINRLFWKRLYRLAERRYALSR
jgi:NitT/TauT family transport system permease protein